ncbi:MAG: OmpA family protein [Flavobacteriia bacterium]|jgi:peptidoglycan-associated lipoprotein
MNFKPLLTLVFVGFSYLMNAQMIFVPKQVKKANIEFRNENYCQGAEMCAAGFKKIARKGNFAKKAKGNMAYKTAECYRQTENMKDASEWYEKAITLQYYDVKPEIYFYNAEMYRQMGNFEKAKSNYEKYKALVPEDKRAAVGIRSCEIKDEFKINKTRHVVTNVAALNKEVFEMAPMFGDKKESQLYFSSTRPGGIDGTVDPRSCENYMDLWVSEIDKKGKFMEPKLIPGELINTEDNEGTVCFDGKNKTMFFTRCPNEKKMNLGCDIWVSDLKGKEWGEPTKLILKNHDSISVGHPCVNEEGNYLIFASDADGGFGGKDLYYTTYNKKSKSWETPINMGPEINTAGNELFPTFAKNGDLYYSTDGLPGMGGLDIYKAAKAKDQNKWVKPTTVGFPLNSVSNDYALIEVNEKKGYFTSERTGSVGKNYKPDIWMYELPPNLFDLRVNTVDLFDPSKRIAEVKVTVTAVNENGENVETWDGTTSAEGKVDKDGNPLPAGTIFWEKKPNGDRYILENMTYKIKVEKPKYESVKEGTVTTIGVNYDQHFVVDMPLLKREPIRLPEVRYPLNQWTFVNDSTINSLDSLNFVYDLLMKYPNLKLELSSHTDSRSGNIYNQVLSENRAKACFKYLVETKGIDPKRIVPVGKGESTSKTVYLTKEGKYVATMPADTAGVKTIVLKEAYINAFKGKDKVKFELLHQFNRRTEGAVLDLNFDPATAPAVPEEYFKFKALPKDTRK